MYDYRRTEQLVIQREKLRAQYHRYATSPELNGVDMWLLQHLVKRTPLHILAEKYQLPIDYLYFVRSRITARRALEELK